MPSEILTYKQKPILKLTSAEDKFVRIQFGIKKAKLISSEIETIKQFILNNPEAPKESQEVKQ